MCRGWCLLERVEFMFDGSEFLSGAFPLLDHGRGLVTELGHEGCALLCKLDKVDKGGEDEAGAFLAREVEVLCIEVHDAGGVCKAGEVVEEEVVCDAGDVEILEGVRPGEGGEGRHTVFGSSRAASALWTGSWRTSGAMEVTCSRQAVYTPVTKSEEGRASCSLLTERPHSESAAMISGTGMFGNQYCPAMFGLVTVLMDDRDATVTWSLIGRERDYPFRRLELPCPTQISPQKHPERSVSRSPPFSP